MTTITHTFDPSTTDYNDSQVSTFVERLERAISERFSADVEIIIGQRSPCAASTLLDGEDDEDVSDAVESLANRIHNSM